MEIITINPVVANGEPCIRDTGFTVKQLQKLLATCNDAEIMESYPYLTIADIWEVRKLNGDKPNVAQPIYFDADTVKAAYLAMPVYPFEVWLKAYQTGEVLPPLQDDIKHDDVIDDDPNEQNLPE